MSGSLVGSDFGGGSDRAEFGVDGDLVDEFERDFGLGLLLAAGVVKVGAGDLEAVEQQAGAAGIDLVGGDALQDEADGGLDGGAVGRIEERELEVR